MIIWERTRVGEGDGSRPLGVALSVPLEVPFTARGIFFGHESVGEHGCLLTSEPRLAMKGSRMQMASHLCRERTRNHLASARSRDTKHRQERVRADLGYDIHMMRFHLRLCLSMRSRQQSINLRTTVTTHEEYLRKRSCCMYGTQHRMSPYLRNF